jgi:uncharacterized protein YceK
MTILLQALSPKLVSKSYSIVNAGGKPIRWGKFSVCARDLPVSAILDEIAAKETLIKHCF